MKCPLEGKVLAEAREEPGRAHLGDPASQDTVGQQGLHGKCSLHLGGDFSRGLQECLLSSTQRGAAGVWGHNFSEETTLTDKGCGSTAAGRGTLEGTEGQKDANRGFSPC